MRIGNINPADGPMRIDSELRRDQARAARTPEEHTGDLLALSAGMSLRNLLDRSAKNREAAVRELADDWQSGTYRPDPQRLADRLLDWGFDTK